MEEDRRVKISTENTQTVAVLRLLIWGPRWQHERRSCVCPCSGWHSGRQRGAAEGGKIPAPAGTVSFCLQTLAHQSRHSRCSDVQPYTFNHKHSGSARNRVTTRGCGTCLWPPSNGCHTPGSGARVPAPFYTHGQGRRERCWKQHWHCGQDLKMSHQM